MAHSNQEIIDRFFEAYKTHDMNAIKKVMSENVKWYFIGRHPLAGIKNGLDEVIAFYDAMGKIMASSNSKIEKPIVAENEKYVIECVHSKTNRTDANLDHFACVLWTIENGKIIEGRHFFSDPIAADNFFTAVAPKEVEHKK